jgi:hypothetical protein
MADEKTPDDIPEEAVRVRLVHRPREVLNRLPVPMKWEFTRRHPYYQEWWRVAADHLRASSPDPAARSRGEAAVELLQLIGIADTPYPPGTSFAELGGNDLGRVWVGGAVAPVMLKTLATFLLLGLPPDACIDVGKFLVVCGQLTEASPEEKQYAALRLLGQLAERHPALNGYLDAPIVSINTDAPGRAIDEAIREIVAGFKARRRVPETRRRDDRFDDYLAVWDLREGWVGDHYDCAREQTLAAVSTALGVPIRTAQNQYRRAFFYLVGHKYTPELWDVVVGQHKWSLLTGGVPLPAVFTRRPRRSKERRPVPEATLSGPAESSGQAGFVVDRPVGSETELAALLADIRGLIAQGRSNAEIIAELDLVDDRSDAAIEYIRARPVDFA